MATGENNKLEDRKGSKKNVVESFTGKGWYDVKAQSTFQVLNACRTCVNRTSGTSRGCHRCPRGVTWKVDTVWSMNFI